VVVVGLKVVVVVVGLTVVVVVVTLDVVVVVVLVVVGGNPETFNVIGVEHTPVDTRVICVALFGTSTLIPSSNC
jgi:hypothetical protein